MQRTTKLMNYGIKASLVYILIDDEMQATFEIKLRETSTA